MTLRRMAAEQMGTAKFIGVMRGRRENAFSFLLFSARGAEGEGMGWRRFPLACGIPSGWRRFPLAYGHSHWLAESSSYLRRFTPAYGIPSRLRRFPLVGKGSLWLAEAPSTNLQRFSPVDGGSLWLAKVPSNLPAFPLACGDFLLSAKIPSGSQTSPLFPLARGHSHRPGKGKTSCKTKKKPLIAQGFLS